MESWVSVKRGRKRHDPWSDHNGHLRDHSLSPGSGAQKAVHTRAKTQQQADDQPPRNPVLVILALVFWLWV